MQASRKIATHRGSHTASQLVASDRLAGFPEDDSAFGAESARIECAYFPSLKHGGNRPLCQLRFTAAGLVVLGMTEPEEAKIRSEEIQASVSLAGGVAGAISSDRHASAARALLEGAFESYRNVVGRLSTRGVREAASSAPAGAYFLPRQTIRGLVTPSGKNPHWTLDTDLGPVELLERPDEESRRKVKDWLVSGDQEGGQEMRWTMASALLHFRQTGSLRDPAGQIGAFCAIFARAENEPHAHTVLREALPLRLFVRFLEGMAKGGTTEARSLARAVSSAEAVASRRRATQGIAMALGGPVVAWALFELAPIVEGWLGPWVRFLLAPGVFGGLLGGLLILPVWGTARLVRAVVSMVQVRRLDSSRERQSREP